MKTTSDKDCLGYWYKRLDEHRNEERPATRDEALAIAKAHRAKAAEIREKVRQDKKHADSQIGNRWFCQNSALKSRMSDEHAATRQIGHAEAWETVATKAPGQAYQETEKMILDRISYYVEKVS